MRIDFLSGLDNDYDTCLWFFDGKYVGHDDQIDPEDFPSGRIDWHRRSFSEGLDDWDEIYAAADQGIKAMEPFLVPLTKGEK